MKAYGKDIREFYDSAWPEGWYHEDNELETYDYSGRWVLLDGEKYDTSKLGLFHREESDESVSFTSVFSRWKKSRDRETIVLTIPKAKRKEVVSALAAIGVKL